MRTEKEKMLVGIIWFQRSSISKKSNTGVRVVLSVE